MSSTLPQAAHRAAQWVNHSWNPSYSANPVLAYGAVAVVGICSILNPDSRCIGEQIVRDVAHNTSESDFTTTDMVTALVSASMMLRTDISWARKATINYLETLNKTIRSESQSPNDIIAYVAISGINVMGSDSFSSSIEIDWSLLRTGHLEDTKNVLTRIESETQFGLRSKQSAPLLAELLEGAAIHALRQYDLPLGMRCLRARCYLNHYTSLALKTGASFVRLSQCADGSFGDYETAIRRLKLERQLSEAELRIKLPVTFQSLWTLAELEDPSFRFFRYVFGSNGLAELAKEQNRW